MGIRHIVSVFSVGSFNEQLASPINNATGLGNEKKNIADQLTGTIHHALENM